MRPIRIFFFSVRLIFICSLIAGCNGGDSKVAKVKVVFNSQPHVTVKLYRTHYLDEQVIFTSVTDSIGVCAFQVALSKPMFAWLQVGDRYAEVYLSPESDFTINEVDKSMQVPVRFLGRGAEVNNYVAWVNQAVDRTSWSNGHSIGELDQSHFSSALDSITSELAAFSHRYTDSVSLPKSEKAMLEHKSRIKLLALREQYEQYQLNGLLSKKWESAADGEEGLVAKIGRQEDGATCELPLDTALIANGYWDYDMLLRFHWLNHINTPVLAAFAGRKDARDLIHAAMDEFIEKSAYADPFREYFTACSLLHWIAQDGITPVNDSILASFARRYPGSKYAAGLKDAYDEWLALEPGKPAPIFTGTTRQGEKISLEDLKGKVLYVDVWATWCGPCIAAIPAHKALQKQLHSVKDVLFLNVSVDSDETAWLTFLAREPKWDGLHIILDKRAIQPFYSLYKIFGVPTYILIDSTGHIVSVKARAPFDPQIRSDIEKLSAANNDPTL